MAKKVEHLNTQKAAKDAARADKLSARDLWQVQLMGLLKQPVVVRWGIGSQQVKNCTEGSLDAIDENGIRVILEGTEHVRELAIPYRWLVQVGE